MLEGIIWLVGLKGLKVLVFIGVGLVGLIGLNVYLNLLWKKSYDSVIGKLSFSSLKMTSVIYPLLRVDDNFKNFKIRAIAKFIWFIIVVFVVTLFDNLTMKIVTASFLSLILVGDFLLATKIKKYIGELVCHDVTNEKTYDSVRKAFNALKIYQVYLYLVFLLC